MSPVNGLMCKNQINYNKVLVRRSKKHFEMKQGYTIPSAYNQIYNLNHK